METLEAVFRSVTALGSSDIQYDPANYKIKYSEGGEMDLRDALNAIGNIKMEFDYADSYEDVNAKFSKLVGNVAIIDCHYAHEKVFPALKKAIRPLIFTDFSLYLALLEIINTWERVFDERGLTFCNFPLQYDGVLKDQSSYYLYDYDTIY